MASDWDLSSRQSGRSAALPGHWAHRGGQDRNASALLMPVEFEPAKKVVSLKIHAVNDASAPTTSYIRGELLQSSFVMTSIEHGTKTRVVAEIHADPKGSVAKWIVNYFIIM